MADDWSDFQRNACLEEQRPEAAANNVDDDDFGDFGGFEAAEPVNPHEAQPIFSGREAGSSPWAVFPGDLNASNARVQPDLLCAQNTFPRHLDPAVSCDSPPSSCEVERDGGCITSQGNDHRPSLFDHLNASGLSSIRQQNAASEAALVDDILDGSFRSPLVAAAEPQQVELHSRGSGSVCGVDLVNTKPGENRQEARVATFSSQVLAASVSNDTSDVPLAMEARPIPPETIRVTMQEESSHLQRLKSSLNEQEAGLQKELSEVTNRNRELDERLEQLQEQLADQQEKYMNLQSKHAAELKEIQTAGHDAVVVVVEEYKDLCKVSMLQQQESAERQLQECLKHEQKKFQELLELQQEKLKEALEAERLQNERRIQLALEEQKREQLAAFEVVLQEEREKHAKNIEKMLEDERVSQQNTAAEFLGNLEQRFQRAVEDQKEQLQEWLSDVRKSAYEAQHAAVEEECQLRQEIQKQALDEERRSAVETRQKAIEKAGEEMRAYIEEQRQMDSQMRRRQYITLELFIQSAQQQLNLLMEKDTDSSASSEPGKS